MIVFFVISLLLLLFGVCIRFFKCYWLISGYNTMPKEKRKNVDIEGLGKLVGNACFVMAGILMIAWILSYLGLTTWVLVDMGLIFVVVIFILIKAQKYDANTHNAKGAMNKETKVIVSVIVAFAVMVSLGVGALLYFGSKTPVIDINSNYIAISGMYGIQIPMQDISDIRLEEKIPKVIRKTNGSDVGPKLKGHFVLEGMGAVRLFVNKDKGLFIYIQEGSSYIIVNDDDAEKTKALYENLKLNFEKSK